jgi:hypothetical protein
MTKKKEAKMTRRKIEEERKKLERDALKRAETNYYTHLGEATTKGL